MNPLIPAAAPHLAPGSQAGAPAPVRRLQPQATPCFAAFFAHPEGARRAALALDVDLHLTSRQMSLLTPADGGRRAFRRAARPWRGPRSDRPSQRANDARDGGLGAVFGGLLGVATSWGWSTLGDLPPDLGAPLWVLLGGVTGVLAGAVAGLLSDDEADGQRFDADIRARLREGLSAVVVHGLAPHEQAAAVSRLQSLCLRWCEESAGVVRL